MAYIDFNETDRPIADEDNLGVITTERIFRIWYELGTGSVTVLKETDLPQRNTGHPEDSNLKMIGKAISSISDDKRVYEVTCSYSTITTDTVTEDDPLRRAPKITWGTFATSIVAEKDNAGGAIENSAGDPYQSPLMKDIFNLEVTIVRNEANYNPDRADSLMGTINSGSVTIAGKVAEPKTALLTQYTGSNQKENEISFWSVTYKIRFKKDTWVDSILDQGFNRVGDAPGAENVPILNDAQEKITVPVKLDKAGSPLAKGAPAEFNEFTLPDEEDFSQLGLQ